MNRQPPGYEPGDLPFDAIPRLEMSDSNCASCSQGKRAPITPHSQYNDYEGNRTLTSRETIWYAKPLRHTAIVEYLLSAETKDSRSDQ